MELPATPAKGRSDVVVLTRVAPEDWQRLRDVRLAALAESPEMFGSTLAKEQSFDEAEWRGRAARPATFLASRDGVDVGMAGVYEFDDGWCVMGMWHAYVRLGYDFTGTREHVRNGRDELLMTKTLPSAPQSR
jgi:hypothetical protein